MKNIMFTEHALGFRYQGRNGMGKQTGLDVTISGVGSSRRVELSPINGKGSIANCFIQVPLDKIDELITALREIKGDTRPGAKPGAVIVLVEGICQEVVSDSPLDVVVLDSSSNGDSDERTLEVNFGPEKEKYICRSCREGSRVDTEFVGKVIRAATEAEAAERKETT